MILAEIPVAAAIMVNFDRLFKEYDMKTSKKAGLEANTNFNNIVRFKRQ